MAELAAGPHATGDADERARRQDRLQRAEAAFDPLPFDGEAARAYGRSLRGRIGRAVVSPRGTRALDLLIAATAFAARLPISRGNRETSNVLTDSSKSSRSDGPAAHQAACSMQIPDLLAHNTEPLPSDRRTTYRPLSASLREP